MVINHIFKAVHNSTFWGFCCFCWNVSDTRFLWHQHQCLPVLPSGAHHPLLLISVVKIPIFSFILHSEPAPPAGHPSILCSALSPSLISVNICRRRWADRWTSIFRSRFGYIAFPLREFLMKCCRSFDWVGNRSQNFSLPETKLLCFLLF